MSFRLKLWAICDMKSERLDLGHANFDGSSTSREAVIGRVLIFTQYWGSWKGTRVRIVAGGTPESLNMRDATDEIIESYLLKNPTDDVAKFVLTGKTKKQSPLPEILLTYNNGVFEMLGEPL